MVRWLTVALILLLAGPLAAAPSVAESRRFMTQWEGCHMVAYHDGNGWSAGVGHSLTANGERPRPRYTAAQVDRWFAQDFCWSLDSCRAGVTRYDQLPPDLQLICQSVAWTVGRTGFQRFTTFRLALSHRDYRAAARALQQSRWASQVSERRRDHHISVLIIHASP